MTNLLFTVRFFEGRYHGLIGKEGRPEWPPSPARLFQALIAGAAKGMVIHEEDRVALEWLEWLEAPIIAAPTVHRGQLFTHFMPNNDFDTINGDPSRIAKIRKATKRFFPQIFDEHIPFLYIWFFDHGFEHAERMCNISHQLYQLGRGVDMAWADAEILESNETKARLATHSGAIYYPSSTGKGRMLARPIQGSLNRLVERYQKGSSQFQTISKTSSKKKAAVQSISRPPKPIFKQEPYDSPPAILLYELRNMTRNSDFLLWPLRETTGLVEKIRNDAAARLKSAFPKKAEIISHVFGLCRDATEKDKSRRLRIIALPSVGHSHADYCIRRLLVEIPPNCPFPANDIAWAFSTVGAIDQMTGEIGWMLVPTEDRNMLVHYGIGGDAQTASRIWRTVTPMALPVAEPSGRKKGAERADFEHRAATLVVQALRHAGVAAKPISIRIQREPFEAKGALAEDFAQGTRFSPARLWHVEITFDHPLSGPLLAGDGRYLGLGLMKPVRRAEGVFALSIVNGLVGHPEPQSIAHALRRAVMALVQERLGPGTALPTFFTGHEVNGTPARRGGRSHLAFVFDAVRQRLLVVAPHLMEGRQPNKKEREQLNLLGLSLAELSELRAGSSGVLRLSSWNIDESCDLLFVYSKTWVTQTEYHPTRYGKGITPEQTIINDVKTELNRRGFPLPASIEKVKVSIGPKGGLSAHLKLAFATAVKGPILLGKDCNFGSGLFVASPT